MRQGKGLDKEENHRQQYGDAQREAEEGKAGVNGDGRRLDFGR